MFTGAQFVLVNKTYLMVTFSPSFHVVVSSCIFIFCRSLYSSEDRLTGRVVLFLQHYEFTPLIETSSCPSFQLVGYSVLQLIDLSSFGQEIPEKYILYTYLSNDHDSLYISKIIKFYRFHVHLKVE